jgi:hypothetical protein
MKPQIEIRSLFAGILLGAATVFSIAATGNGSATKWEYRFLRQHTLSAIEPKQTLEQAINAAAGDGWEAAGYAADANYGESVLLRRAKK